MYDLKWCVFILRYHIWLTRCQNPIKKKIKMGDRDGTQLVEHWTGTPLTQDRFPGAARDSSPRVTSQCRFSYSVHTPLCATAGINICIHVKDPVAHVGVRWIVETLEHPAYTIGWVVRLSQLTFPGESNLNFPWEKSHWDNRVVNPHPQKKQLLSFKLGSGFLYSPGLLLEKVKDTVDFCSCPVDFLALLVQAFNTSTSLNVSMLGEILEFVLSSPFGPTALVALFTAVTDDSSKLMVPAFSALLRVIVSAEKVSSVNLTTLLEILCQ